MEKVYCKQCKYSRGESVCGHPLNVIFRITYYNSKHRENKHSQSVINLFNLCGWYKKRNGLSQFFYNLTNCEL